MYYALGIGSVLDCPSRKGLPWSTFTATGVAQVGTVAGFLVGLGFRVSGSEFKI